MTHTTYDEFIESKKRSLQDCGFTARKLNEKLFPFQQDIVRKALKRGKYAIFADCGLGKTFMQLEWAQKVAKKTNKPVLLLCPLQLDTIERLIHLYTNKGDVVFTPFLGIGSEAYQAVKMGRRAIGFELKPSYYHVARQNMRAVVELKNQPTLF